MSQTKDNTQSELQDLKDALMYLYDRGATRHYRAEIPTYSDKEFIETFNYVISHTNNRINEVLDRLQKEFPDTSDDSNFSPDGAGGWHLETYKLAIDDFNDAIEYERTRIKEGLK